MKPAGFWLKGVLIVPLAILAITFLVSGGYAQPAPKVWHLRFTNDMPGPPNSHGICADVFAREIKRLTGGRVVVDQVLHGGALSKPGEALDHMSRRVADGGLIGYIYYPGRLRTLAFLAAIPFGPPTSVMTAEIISKEIKEAPELEDETAKENIHVAAVNTIYAYDLISTKPVRTLGDFKGMRIAVSGRYFNKAFERVGAASPAMPLAERTSALTTGAIDGSCLTIFTHHEMGFFKIAKHVTILRFPSMTIGLLAINADLWKTFPKDIQQQIGEAAVNARKELQRLELVSLDKSKVAMKEMGVQLYELSNSDIAKWAEMISDFPKDWITEAEGKGIPGRKIMERFIALAKQAGYVFPFEPKLK